MIPQWFRSLCIVQLFVRLFVADPPMVPAHVPLVVHHQTGYRKTDPPALRRQKTWHNARSAASAMARAYPHDAVIQLHQSKVERGYEWVV